MGQASEDEEMIIRATLEHYLPGFKWFQQWESDRAFLWGPTTLFYTIEARERSRQVSVMWKRVQP